MVAFFERLKKILVLPRYYNDEIIIKIKHFLTDEKPFEFVSKMILLNILQNFAVYLLFYFAHDNFSK